MPARPAPRRSSLSGQSPVTAAPPGTDRQLSVPDVDIPLSVPAPDPGVPRAVSPPATPALTTPAPQTVVAGKVKVSFYQDPADTARMRGAFLATQTLEGPRSLSGFMASAVMSEVARLEARYNGGRPFPTVGSGIMPRGAPMRL